MVLTYAVSYSILNEFALLDVDGHFRCVVGDSCRDVVGVLYVTTVGCCSNLGCRPVGGFGCPIDRCSIRCCAVWVLFLRLASLAFRSFFALVH